jgi:hypothetical protein
MKKLLILAFLLVMSLNCFSLGVKDTNPSLERIDQLVDSYSKPASYFKSNFQLVFDNSPNFVYFSNGINVMVIDGSVDTCWIMFDDPDGSITMKFVDFLVERYGKPTTSPRIVSWDLPNSMKLELSGYGNNTMQLNLRK